MPTSGCTATVWQARHGLVYDTSHKSQRGWSGPREVFPEEAQQSVLQESSDTAVLLPAIMPASDADRSRTVQAPISFRFILVLLLVCFASSRQVAADPPASYTSTSPTIPGVYGTNTANGDGVFGNATTGRGVVGASEGGIGVQGNAREGRGVVGVSDTKAGVEGQSQGHVGVWGETRAPSGAGGEFHNYGGGDLIRAGPGERFACRTTAMSLYEGSLLV